MKTHFDIAREKYERMPLIPVGATGFMANSLFTIVMKEFSKYYPISTNAYKIHFEKLSTRNSGLESLVEATTAILDLWRR